MQHDITSKYVHLRNMLEHECFVRGCNVSMCHTIQMLSEFVDTLGSANDDSVSDEVDMLASHLSDLSMYLRMGILNCYEAYFLTTTKIDTFIDQVLRPHIVSIYGPEFDDSDHIFKGITVGKA